MVIDKAGMVRPDVLRVRHETSEMTAADDDSRRRSQRDRQMGRTGIVADHKIGVVHQIKQLRQIGLAYQIDYEGVAGIDIAGPLAPSTDKNNVQALLRQLFSQLLILDQRPAPAVFIGSGIKDGVRRTLRHEFFRGPRLAP